MLAKAQQQLHGGPQSSHPAPRTPNSASPKALIAPHAGYIYSGPIAASAFSCLIAEADFIKRVVLVGPSHFAEFPGLAASSARAFATPLGEVPLDTEAVRMLVEQDQARILDAAHVREHALEVELPFMQIVLKEFAIVPLLVGLATPEQISAALETLWGGPETRLVVSSDLSHYLDSETARRIDGITAMGIQNLEPTRIGEGQACGRLPILGLVHAARKRGLRGAAIDLRNSGDTAGPHHQVVGYGAFLFAPCPQNS